MFQIIQQGYHVNSVYLLLQRFIAKRYRNRSSMQRDQQGMRQWRKYLSDSIAPKTYVSIASYSLSEKLSGKNTHTKTAKKRLLKKLARTYASLIETYRYHHETMRSEHLNWKMYVKKKKEESNLVLPLIKELLNEKDYALLTKTVKQLCKMDWGIHHKIPLHRDLHWENIFEDDRKIRFIDFEHFCLGPIEYEFSNSLFWNDIYSVPFEDIVSELGKVQVFVNKTLSYQLVCLYFIDQVAIAHEQKNQEKIILLCSLLTEYLKTYKKKLEIVDENSVFI